MALASGSAVDQQSERAPKAPRGRSDASASASTDRAALNRAVPEGAADSAARWFEQIDLQAYYASKTTNTEREGVVLAALEKAREAVVDLERLATRQLDNTRHALAESQQLSAQFTQLEQRTHQESHPIPDTAQDHICLVFAERQPRTEGQRETW